MLRRDGVRASNAGSAQGLPPQPPHSRSAKRRREIDPRKRQFAPSSAAAGIGYAGQDYPLPLSLYSVPPTGEIALEQFEEWAIARLTVLCELEACAYRNRSPDETRAHIRPLLDKHVPLHPNSARNADVAAERARDHYSHFILRLAFAATDELRRRFVRLETALFRLRWRDADVRDRADFVRLSAFSWERLPEPEAAAMRPELLTASGQPVTAASVAADDAGGGWFRLPWEQVADLVESRRALVRRGFAYVSARDLTSLVVPEFTRRLEAAMETTAKALPTLAEAERLEPILNHLAHAAGAAGGSGAMYDEAADGLGSLLAGGAGAQLRHVHPTAANVPRLSAGGYFPPCMSQIHLRLAREGHLKHFARLEYTLFLKAVGLSLDEAVAFWRSGLRTKTPDQFKKEYEYNIRHAYGAVGNNAEIRRAGGYSAFSCASMIKNAAGPGGADPNCHGCPFRAYHPSQLRVMLERDLNLPAPVAKQVEADAAQKQYLVACNRVFESQHDPFLPKVGGAGPAGMENAAVREALKLRLGEKEGSRFMEQISHPNEYFRRSFLLRHWDALVANAAAGQ